MIQAPFNNILIKVKTRYIRHISTLLQRLAIQENANVDPTDFVNIIGEVVSLPKAISKDERHKNYLLDGIEVGDTAIFSYRVIHSFVLNDPKDDVLHKNAFMYYGQEYFVCDITELFGVIKPDGEIKMLNGYVMAKQPVKAKIILVAGSKKTKGSLETDVIHYGTVAKNKEPFPKKKFDTIHIHPNKFQTYEINEKKFCIVKQQDIYGYSPQPVSKK